METAQHGKSAGRRIEEKKTAEDAGGGNLKRKGVPDYPGRDFDAVVYGIWYSGFLLNLSTSNAIAGYTRDFAETEWRILVRNKWTDWAKYKPELERKAELNHALSQVDGYPGFNASEYWAEYSKPKQKTAKTKSGDVKIAEDGFHEESGLGLPMYDESFDKLAAQLGYKEFLKRIDAINGPIFNRAKADSAWKYFIQQKFYTWKTDLPSDKKDKILEDAFNQTTNGTASFYRKKMDLYWQKKQENLLKAQLGIAKDAVMKNDGADLLEAQLGISEDAVMKDDSNDEDEDVPAPNPEVSKKRKANWRMIK